MADFTSKKDEQFFGAIGRLTVSWAHIEAGLDIAVLVAHQAFGGAKIEADIPRTALNRKLRYLRRWVKTVPEPTFQASVNALLVEIEEASELRHDLIHGFIIEQAEGSGEAEMIRLLRGTTTLHEPKRYKVTTTSILEAAVQANKLASRSLRLGTGLQEAVLAFLAQKGDQPPS